MGDHSSGLALKVKRLVAGSGINITEPAGGAELRIENSQTSGAGVTMEHAGSGDAQAISLVADGSGPSLGVRGLLAGSGIALTRLPPRSTDGTPASDCSGGCDQCDHRQHGVPGECGG